MTARTLCEMGDSLIVEETSKVYKNKKDMKKGEVTDETSNLTLDSLWFFVVFLIINSMPYQSFTFKLL